MNNPIPRHGVAASLNACIKSATVSYARFLNPAACGLLLLAMLTVPAQASTVDFHASRMRVTVPINYTGSALITNWVHISGLNSNNPTPVDFTVSGLPSGATYTLTDSNHVTMTSSTVDTNLWLTLNLENVAEGLYTFSLNGSGGASNSLLLTLQVGYIWNGATNGPAGYWSDSSQWQGGGAVPGPGDDVIFDQTGARTNLFTNSIVDADTTIDSLRFAQWDSTAQYHTLLINPGVTLAVTGTNGLYFLRDTNDVAAGISRPITATITGQDGSLIVSNQNGNIAMLVGNFRGGSGETLDLSGLGNFTANVYRIGLGDYQLYPHFDNLLSNSFGGGERPANFFVTLDMARTNLVKATYADPNDYTNSERRDYSFTLGNNIEGGTSSNPRYTINLGLTNAFFVDSLCFAHASLSSQVQFNSALRYETNVVAGVTNVTTNAFYAYFRGTNGGRMTMWAESDLGQGDTNQSSGSNDKTTVDLSDGTVDAMVDILALSQDRLNPSDGGNAQSTLILGGSGSFNVNNAYLGYQTAIGATNVQYCQGTLIVSNNVTFTANNTLTLGYTTDSNTIRLPENNRGQLTVGPGGAVYANTITVGGPAGLSTGNTITINSNATLVVSNTVASSTKKLTTLTMNNGAMTLFINGNTGPYVYVTNFNTTGAGRINIGGITNLTTPAQVSLVKYDVGTPTVLIGNLPSGYSGTIINNGAGSTVDVFLTTKAPKQLAWRGYVNNSWDTATKNWLDLDTGLHTNFATLDHVYFDDTAGVPTNINLAVSAITPGALFMTNNTENYFITGSGSIVGASIMTKAGTGTLDIEGNTTLSLNVVQGSLIGSGTIYAATVESGARMLYSGTISANVVCAGSGTSSGSIKGSVHVLSGGTFTNLNTVYGPLVLDNGSFMKNAGTVSYLAGYTTTVNSNAFLWNLGTINGDMMQVDGTLEDSSGSLGITISQLNINNGSTFIPGGDGIGSSYVYSSGIGTYAGRLTLNSGSTTVLKLNPGAGTSTQVRSTYLDYGPSQSVQDQNGGTLLISNVGGAFAAGQVFNVFGNSFFSADAPGITGASTNSYPVMSPSSPGPGLSWDLSHLWPNGLIGVINTPNVTLTNSFSIVDTTNLVEKFTWSTNVFQQWVLETQENPLSVGLSNNWTRIAGSWTNTADDLATGFRTRYITNSITSTNPAVFFRLAFP